MRVSAREGLAYNPVILVSLAGVSFEVGSNALLFFPFFFFLEVVKFSIRLKCIPVPTLDFFDTRSYL
jgi:hypothetical protein